MSSVEGTPVAYSFNKYSPSASREGRCNSEKDSPIPTFPAPTQVTSRVAPGALTSGPQSPKSRGSTLPGKSLWAHTLSPNAPLTPFLDFILLYFILFYCGKNALEECPLIHEVYSTVPLTVSTVLPSSPELSRLARLETLSPLIGNSPSPSPHSLATTVSLFGSMTLTTLGASYRWNHSVYTTLNMSNPILLFLFYLLNLIHCCLYF